jgi:hypothetical protein
VEKDRSEAELVGGASSRLGMPNAALLGQRSYWLKWKAAERDARAARRGLWADKAPVPPWEWRASEKGRKRQPAGTW